MTRGRRSTRRGARHVLLWALALGPPLVLGCPEDGRHQVRAGDEASLPPPVIRRRTRGTPAPAPAPRAQPPAPAPAPAPAPRARPPAPAPAPRAQPGALPPPVVIRRGGPTPPPREVPPRAPRPAPVPAGPGIAPGARPGETDSGGISLTPPERPRPPAPKPGSVTFENARPGGGVWTFPDGDDDPNRIVHVLIGTPRIHRPAYEENGRHVESLTIKANTIVAWVDRRFFGEADLASMGGGASAGGTAPGPRRATGSVIPEGLLGIYAEGAVEMVFGKVTFRSEILYLDPHAYKALLVSPRFDGRSIGISNAIEPLPIHVRARKARLVARGLTLFDDAEVAASRAEDRIMLRVKELSVREYEEGAAEADAAEPGDEQPHLLGYRSATSQWYSGRQVQGRGERLPLFWLPAAEFGLSDEVDALTQPLKRLRTGSISHLGRFAFVRIGDVFGDKRDPIADWFLELGAYTKRGVAGGADLRWDHMKPGDRVRGFGQVETWGVFDNKTVDSDLFRHGRDFRGRITSESRTYLTRDLYADVEFNDFSDRGFNNEYFERDDLQHKDRESYARLRWAPPRPGNLVATLDGKWHQRTFVSETTELPQAGLWVLPAPLLVPARRGGLGIDLTSTSKAGYLGRRFDSALPDADYEAWRFHSDTRLNMGVDVGDVRLSGYAGAAGTIYESRTDGGSDLARSTLLAGARANLQLHRAFAAAGTWLELDGLRHVIDLDVEFAGRFHDSHAPADVPYFDLLEEERERTALILRLRNRLQTRNPVASAVRPVPSAPGVPPAAPQGGLRSVVDLEVAVKKFVDDVGPYGRDSPGAVEISLFGRPRSTLDVAGEAEIDWRRGLETASFGAGVRTSLREKPLALFGGIRHVRDRSLGLTADLSWRYSDRYALRVLEVYDFDEGQNLTRILFRRYSPDHIIVFGVSIRNDDLGLEFSVEPAIGGRTTEGPQAFKDEPDLNPWGGLR